MRTTISSSLRLWMLLGATAVALLLLGALFLYYPGLASAEVSTEAAPGTTIIVNSKGDGTKTGNCTLREAIEAANTNKKVDKCAAGSSTDRDAIHFALGDKATITLGTLLPTISDDAGLSINGLKNKITVSGDDRVRVFEVDSGAKLKLNHLRVADGNSAGGGGLLINLGGSEVKVRNSTFSGNSADTQSGGGILNLSASTLTVTNSTFSGNSAFFSGGGIENNEEGTLTVINSTISGNSATGGIGSVGGYGSGIMNRGTLEVTNSTISENFARTRSSGIMNFGTATVRNTILANSIQGANCDGDQITDGGYNIEDATSCSFSSNNNSMPSTEPLLADSLANNGGPTKTIALLKGSPAINAIPKTENGCGTEVTTDQRGVKRPQGKGCDIGSFEKKQ